MESIGKSQVERRKGYQGRILRSSEKKGHFWTELVRPPQKIMEKIKLLRGVTTYQRQDMETPDRDLRVRPVRSTGLLSGTSRWLYSRKDRRRLYIADALQKVLRLLERPDGEDRVLGSLDNLIKERNRPRRFLSWLTTSREVRLKSDAWMQAFTWAASPGGVE